MNENDKQAEPVAWGNLSEDFADSERVLITNEPDAKKYHEQVYELTPLFKRPAPAVAQGEPVDLRELFERLLFGTYAGKDSYYNDEQIKHGCFEKAQELVDVAKRMNIALYTAPPAVAVNDDLAKAVHYPDCWDVAAYPTLADALRELATCFQCCECVKNPAVAVNEQMYSALKMVMDDPQSLEGRPRTFECVTEAIGAYEAAKKGGV